MAILTAIQKGEWVSVYNEKNQILWQKTGELYGFTSKNVTIKKGEWLSIYDEKGQIVTTRHC